MCYKFTRREIPGIFNAPRTSWQVDEADLFLSERLAALVPRPRLHLIRFHGVLAPNAKLRSKIVPAPAERVSERSSEDAHAQGEIPRMSWALV